MKGKIEIFVEKHLDLSDCVIYPGNGGSLYQTIRETITVAQDGPKAIPSCRAAPPG